MVRGCKGCMVFVKLSEVSELGNQVGDTPFVGPASSSKLAKDGDLTGVSQKSGRTCK